MKALHCLFAIKKGKYVFVIAGVIFRTLEERGMEQDVEVFPAFRISLFNGMDSVGKNDDQVIREEGVRLSP